MARRKKHSKKGKSKKEARGLRRGAKHIGRKGKKKMHRKGSRKHKRG